MIAQWTAFGASVRGNGHIRAHLPNQDCFRIANCHWGDAIVASDGVGSCATSAWGSHAACRAVVASAKVWINSQENLHDLLNKIHASWLDFVKPFAPDQSSATCLFAIRPLAGKITAGMLGDGMLAILKADGTCLELSENKDNSFSNQTIALSCRTTGRQWQTISIPQDECSAILLCTDGVADDLLPEKRADFFWHIFNQGRKLATVRVTSELRQMLEKWPVPKHSDDKTLACLYKRKEAV